MQQITLMDKYPLYLFTLDKNETPYTSVDAIIDYLKAKIDAHPVAIYIATFDHYAHTKSLADGVIAQEIQAGKNIIFCFGKELPKPEVMGVRPRSIGVADTGEKFVISFLEAPNPVANSTMQEWVKSLRG